MRSTARSLLARLTHTRLFQSKPLLAPLILTLWRYLRARDAESGEQVVSALAMRNFRYPILFHDRNDLEYVLYPKQNAEVYLASGGNYEVGETRFCLSRLKPGMICFDVGANIGLYTLLFAKAVGPSGYVHAFEPEPKNYRRLLVNLALNRFDHVTANQAAVFSKSQTVTLNVYPDSLHAWHSLGRPDLHSPGEMTPPEAQLSVAAVSLDDYCRARGVERIDYLKIDVEGAELDVLNGAESLLARGAIGLIQFEVSLAQVKSLGRATDEIFAFLRARGFRCHLIVADGGLGPEAATAHADYANYVALQD